MLKLYDPAIDDVIPRPGGYAGGSKIALLHKSRQRGGGPAPTPRATLLRCCQALVKFACTSSSDSGMSRSSSDPGTFTAPR